jgi:hypothetical protein
MAQASYLPTAIRAPTTGAYINSASSVLTAHAEFFAVVWRSSLPTLRDSDAEDRPCHLNKVITGLPGHVTVIIDDSAPGRLNLHAIEAVLSGVASDVARTNQHVPDGIAGRAS